MYSTSVITIKTTEMVNPHEDTCGPGPKKNFGTKARVGHPLVGNGRLRDRKQLKSGPKTQGKRETETNHRQDTAQSKKPRGM